MVDSLRKPGGIPRDLPRALVGGVKRAYAEELLRQVAWDLAQLEAENKKLRERVRELQAREPERPPAEASPPPEPGTTAQPKPAAGSRARDSDEAARTVLAMAQHAARDLRESTRKDCELILRKARDRARKVEDELERTKASAQAEVEELARLREDLREQLRGMLETLLERAGEAGTKEAALNATDDAGRRDILMQLRAAGTPHER